MEPEDNEDRDRFEDAYFDDSAPRNEKFLNYFYVANLQKNRLDCIITLTLL